MVSVMVIMSVMVIIIMRSLAGSAFVFVFVFVIMIMRSFIGSPFVFIVFSVVIDCNYGRLFMFKNLWIVLMCIVLVRRVHLQAQ